MEHLILFIKIPDPFVITPFTAVQLKESKCLDELDRGVREKIFITVRYYN